eukprot:1257373-Amphidinium_carterae.2
MLFNICPQEQLNGAQLQDKQDECRAFGISSGYELQHYRAIDGGVDSDAIAEYFVSTSLVVMEKFPRLHVVNRVCGAVPYTVDPIKFTSGLSTFNPRHRLINLTSYSKAIGLAHIIDHFTHNAIVPTVSGCLRMNLSLRKIDSCNVVQNSLRRRGCSPDITICGIQWSPFPTYAGIY